MGAEQSRMSSVSMRRQTRTLSPARHGSMVVPHLPHRLDGLPQDVLSRILSYIPAGSIDALAAACASPGLARPLAASLECVDPAASCTEIAHRLAGGVGAYIRALTISFRAVPFCGVQAASGLDDRAFRSFIRAHHNAGGTLEQLRVEFCGGVSGDSVVAAAAKLPNLRRLTFKFAGYIDDSHVAAICRYVGNRLEELDVECSAGVGDASLYAIATHCPNLALLGVAACHRISDDGLLAVAIALGPSLLALDIHDVPRVSDMGVYHIASHCHNLEYLNVWRVCLTSYAIRAIVETSGETLRVLVMGDCIGVDNAAVEAIATQCTVLDELEMPGLQNVSDSAMAMLLDPRVGPPLTSLSIDRCSRLTDATLAALVQCPGLSEVSAVGLSGVTRPGVDALKAESSSLQLCTDDSPPTVQRCDDTEMYALPPGTVVDLPLVKEASEGALELHAM
jgi:hypothetical protein